MSHFIRECCAVVALIVSAAVFAGAQNQNGQTPPSRDVAFARVSIPRLDQAPTLEDFEGMQPTSPLAKHMLGVDKFIGRIPVDPCAKTPIWMGTKDTFFGVEWGDWLNQRLPGSRGVRRLEDANLFFPEEMPNIIAKEAINLWRIHG